MELEGLVRSKNDITINVNATRVFKGEEILSPFGGTTFAKQSSGGYFSALKRMQIMQLYMKNSFEVKRLNHLFLAMIGKRQCVES